MRRTVFVLLLLAALVPTAGTTSAQVIPMGQYSGYSTGTAVHIGALQHGTTRLVDTEVAFSGANVNSSGLGAALINEMEQAYQTATTAADMAAGRGSGLEIGVGTTVPNLTNANQINLGTTVQAFAPVSTELLTANFTDVNLDPIINSDYLRGQAQAIYNEKVCVLGQPISSGLGYAGSARLVGTPSSEMLATNTGENAVNQSRSFTWLIPNGDNTYGLVTETHQILAPLTLIPGAAEPLPDALSIEFAGEWVLRSTATGKPGGAKVEYAPVGSPDPTTKVITVKASGTEVLALTMQQFLSNEGRVFDIPNVGQIALGEDPRAIGDMNTASKPELAANGTVAAAAVDVVRIIALPLADTLDIDLADLRIGHMESRAMVPEGGIQCSIPVTKTGTPASVEAGTDQIMTYTITVPSDVEAFKAIACDVVNLRVTDVTTADPGVMFNIVSASNGGKISGNTVTWDSLGTYKPGDPAIVLTIGLTVPKESAAGMIRDTATATGALGNCKGNASTKGAALAGLAKLEAAAMSGRAVFSGPNATRANPAPAADPNAGVLGDTLGAGPTPIGGVQTGAGGMSQRTNSLLPIGAGLGSLALLAGLMTSWRRRRIG